MARGTDPGDGPAQAAYVALSLDHTYQALETLLVRVERALELPARVGEHSHRAVLADATSPIEGVRPALVPASVEADWRQVQRFRHFLRHAYDVALDADELRRLAAHLDAAVAATAPVVTAFADSLA